VNAIVKSEFEALTASDRTYLNFVIGPPLVLLSGGEVRTALTTLFGVGTTSRTNLIALASVQISRAVYLYAQPVSASDIALARTV
jgi:hypothetical protein